MLDLEWKPQAVADLVAIVDYISDDNPDAEGRYRDQGLATATSAATLQGRARGGHARDGRALQLSRRLRRGRGHGHGSSRAARGTVVAAAMTGLFSPWPVPDRPSMRNIKGALRKEFIT